MNLDTLLYAHYNLKPQDAIGSSNIDDRQAGATRTRATPRSALGHRLSINSVHAHEIDIVGIIARPEFGKSGYGRLYIQLPTYIVICSASKHLSDPFHHWHQNSSPPTAGATICSLPDL